MFWLTGVLCLVAIAWPGWGQDASTGGQQASPSSAVKLEDFDRQVGPFELKGQRFTVVLHMKRVQGQGAVVDPVFQETLTRVEIKDAAGTVHYERTFPLSEVSGDSFTDTTAATVKLLQGKQGSGLLVTYGVSPSTPRGGQSWQVFGLFDQKLVPFSKPVYLEGDLLNDKDGAPVVQTSLEPKLRGDVLHFRVWTGNFDAIIPLKVDWLLGKFALAWQCQKMTSRGWRPLCQVRVEAERVPQEEDLTFVRLHQEPEEGFGTPAHVVVKKDSKIEFLAAETEVVWKEDAEGVGLSVSDDVWIKVRIDGKEGWIHTQEDFSAIGLPQAG